MSQSESLPQFLQIASRLLGLAVASLLFATVVSASDLPQPVIRPIEMYPEINIEFTVDESIMAIVVEVSSDRPYHPITKTIVTRTVDGRLATTIACPFMGSGVLRVFDAAAPDGSTSLIETFVSCIPEGISTGEPAPLPLAQTQSAAAASATEPSITTIAGVIENSVVTRFRRGDGFSQFFDFQGNLTGTNETFSQEDTTWTQTDTQRCLTSTQLFRSTTNGTVHTTTTNQCYPNTPGDHFIDLYVQEGTSQTTYKRFNGSVREISSGAVIGNGMVTATVRFPDIPEGGVVREVRVIPSGISVWGVGYSRPPNWQFPGSTIDEGTPVFVGFLYNCPDGVSSQTVTWTYPETVVDPDGKFNFSFPVVTTCIYNETYGDPNTTDTIVEINEQIGVLTGFFRYEVDVEVQDAMLELTADLEDLHPTNRRVSDPNVFGQSSTTILARLLEAPEGTYTIDLDVRSFDSDISGHDHASSPPKSFWGKLDGTAGSGSTAPAASCEITVDASGEGDCEVEYQADEVAGKISIGATVDVDGQMLEEEIPLDIFIPFLLRLPASTGYVPRGVTSQHQINNYATIETIFTMLDIAREFELATGGFRLGIDDMSLPLGGFFDVKKVNGVHLPWDPRAHKVHRDGRAADISKFWFDASDSTAQEVKCQVDTIFRQVVWSAGATPHCESGGRKHINFR